MAGLTYVVSVDDCKPEMAVAARVEALGRLSRSWFQTDRSVGLHFQHS